MRIAVVTPYCREPIEKIERCHASVVGQTVVAQGSTMTHFLVADGYPRAEIAGWEHTVHFVLPNHNDYGDTPRLVGTASAATLGYDAVLLLDADNWFEPEHVERLLMVQRASGADIVTCPRMLRRLDGSALGVCDESDGVAFNDTNCYLVMRRAFPVFRAWSYKDPSLGIVGDRVFWQAIRQNGITLARADGPPTVNYETSFATHYRARGEEPPPGCKLILQTTDGRHVMMKWETFREMVRQQKAKLL